MKNLFDYATKELSQDAFLMWLFENYDCEDPEVRDASFNLINILTNIDKTAIKKVSAEAQWHNIDIKIEIVKRDGSKGYLFIEDKTTSEEHNQLIDYNDAIQKEINNSETTYKIFYKTAPMKQDELQRVANAGWNLIQFEDIKDFWEIYKSAKNIILQMYSKRVDSLWNDYHYEDIPKNHNIAQWFGFFSNVVKPHIEEKCNCDFEIHNYHGQYCFVKIKPKGKMYSKVPYLEIRSRECINGKFRSLMLMYDSVGSDGKVIGYNEILKQIAQRTNSIFESKKHYKKQVSETNYAQFANADDFKKICVEMTTEFLEIIEEVSKNNIW